MSISPKPAPQQGSDTAPKPQQGQTAKPPQQQGSAPVIRDWAAF